VLDPTRALRDPPGDPYAKGAVPMPARPFLVEPKSYTPALDIVGEHVTVLASAEATGGYEIFLQRGPEGSGPPPHSHPWDESFFVMKGSVDFGFGDQAGTAAAGALVHVPGGTVHWFRFGRGGAEMVTMTSRAGAAKFFTDVAREIAPTDPDLGKLAAIAARHGLNVQA
jgi:quercetin dioxygenase-like cupin family protein